MNNKEILESLFRYQKEEFRSTYLNKIIKYFEQTNIEKKIKDNDLELAGVRLNVLYNINRYKYYISKTLPDKNISCYRKLNLTPSQRNNLLNQLYGVDNNIFLICEKLTDDFDTLYFIISEEDLNISGFITKNYYEWISTFLGVQSFYFLEHQNLENYCKKKITKHSTKAFDMLKKYKNSIKDFTWQEKDRYLIFSGMILQFLGTLYTQDLDLMYASNDNNYGKHMDMVKKLKIDSYFILENKIISPQKKTLNYLYEWFKYKLPKLGGASDIYEILLNPKHHFHYFGLKCIDIISTVKRIMSRSNAYSLIDILLLKRFNNLQFYKDYCVKNIVIRQGNAIVINNKMDLEKFYNKVKKYMKIWYDLDYDLDYLKKTFPKCEKKHKTIYYGDRIYTNNKMSAIFKFNRFAANIILKKYITDKNNILDIGIGKCNSVYDYLGIGIKNIYGIEPSFQSIEICHKRFANKNTNVNVVQGYGDQEWDKSIISNKYDNISLVFSIHYMAKNLDILAGNINKVSKKNTKLFIFYIDGNKIFNRLQNKRGRQVYEIKYKDDIMYGVYEYDDKVTKSSELNKMLFYIKDVYGVSNGSEEYLMNTQHILKQFDNFTKVGEGNMEELLHGKLKKMINLPFQKEIIGLHKYLVLQRK